MCYLQIESINKDDYFVKNAEFTTWLREHKSKFFNEMDSDETRALFGKIVHKSFIIANAGCFSILTWPFWCIVSTTSRVTGGWGGVQGGQSHHTYACFTSAKTARQAVTAICMVSLMCMRQQIVMQANAVPLIRLVTHCKRLQRPLYRLCTSAGGQFCLFDALV